MKNPWLQLPQSAPFVLLEDKEVLCERGRSVKGNDEFSVLPQPFTGDFTKAKAVLLLLNPGFSNGGLSDISMHEHCTQHNCSDYIRRNRQNLLHQHGKRSPFFLLDKQFAFFVGFDWWYGNCKPVIDKVGHENVESKLACVNLFPYHSVEYNHLPQPLPSQEYSFQLVREALKEKKLVIIMRGKHHWNIAVPQTAKCPVARNPRKSTLSPKNLGENLFKKLCKVLEE